MLDTIVGTIHSKKNVIPGTDSGSFQPIVLNKNNNEALISVINENEPQASDPRSGTLDVIQNN